jgi:formate hydrogenlyase subunit 3/multisubunit Na+/H+ antiporter MnhD subunit
MNAFPRLLIITGIALIVIGLIWMFGVKFFNFGRLPGDIVVEKERFGFYFPIVTCIVISVVASLILYIIRLLRG